MKRCECGHPAEEHSDTEAFAYKTLKPLDGVCMGCPCSKYRPDPREKEARGRTMSIPKMEARLRQIGEGMGLGKFVSEVEAGDGSG